MVSKEKEDTPLKLTIEHKLPAIIGECKKCRSGLRSLVLMSMSEDKDKQTFMNIQCMACFDKQTLPLIRVNKQTR